jgi:hypothetical protein
MTSGKGITLERGAFLLNESYASDLATLVVHRRVFYERCEAVGVTVGPAAFIAGLRQ